MRKYYEVNQHNSTVNGSPGRDYDWAKFVWNQEQKHDFGDMRYSAESPFVPDYLKGKRIGSKKAPKPCVDGCLIAPNCQYLHVPYDFGEQGTIYRVRPNESMYAGKKYRGKQIIKQTAVKRKGKWYWCLQF